MPDTAICRVGYTRSIPVALPLITRREIVREYRPDETLTVDSGIRALRHKHALSRGLSIPARGPRGALGGRRFLYSALNRDSARAARRGEIAAAVRIGQAATQLEALPESQAIVKALTTDAPASRDHEPPGSAAALAAALSSPSLTPIVLALERATAAQRRQLGLGAETTVLSGRIDSLTAASAVLALDGASPLSVPIEMLAAAGLRDLGAAVSVIWEILPGGRTLLTLEPAIDIPDVNDLGEPLIDLYGTPWGLVLAGADHEALAVSGTPTITIPAGIPDVD